MLNFLDYFFIYGIKQEFFINHSFKYHTIFSGILSLITFSIITFFLIFFGKEIFFKKLPDFNQIEIKYDIQQSVNFSDTNLLFAFAFQYSNYSNYIDPSIYEVEAFYIQESLDPNLHKKIRNINSLEICPCTNLNSSIPKEYLNALELSKLYCINRTSDIIINGSALLDHWNYVKLNFKRCQNKSYCKEINEIDDNLKGGYISIFSSDISVDPDKNKDSISIYGLNRYTSLLPYMNKDVWVFIKNIEIITDNGIFFEDKKKEIDTGFETLMECTTENKNINSKFMKIIITSSASKYIYTRNYKKLGTIIADITSLSKAIVIFGKILSCLVDRVYYRYYILSFFDSDEKKLRKNEKNYNSFYNNTKIHLTNNFLKKTRLALPIISKVNEKKSISMNFKNTNKNYNTDISMEKFMKKNSIIHSLIENKYSHNNKLKEITFFNLIKKILCEKKEIILNFRNISIYFEVVRYLKIFKDLNIMQKSIFEESEKRKLELNYNFKKNSDIVNYIYKNHFEGFIK